MFRGQNLGKKCFEVSRLAKKRRKDITMNDEVFELVGDTTIEEEEAVKEEAVEENETSNADEEVEEVENQEEEEPKKDQKTQALDAERARRKAAEKELKELKAKLDQEKTKEEDEKAFNERKEAIRKKLLEKDVMDEEVADTILSALGEDLIKTQIENERTAKELSFEQELSKLKEDELFMDADAYKPQIKELMDKGLTVRQAYMASISDAKFLQMKKDLEVEIEQKILNSAKKADMVDVGHAEEKGGAATNRGKYTKREQEIAKETGLTIEEVHKRYMRPNETISIDDIEKL